ncbi:hypothetical protein GTU79_27750 [Sodalis ligni]|uniref:hypothetical protein n=1 Tax=Sodalis ligni TaxID=2697027 RepID=UPI001BDF3784|nr:hypothetical protein [Sodalis ligni]QWA10907.1 hypothetical protein GTU79_27750 [Sodalis ligni]
MLASGIKNQRSGQDGLTHPIKTGTFQSSETPKKSNVKEISNVPVNFSSSLQQSELYSYGVGNRANKPDLVNLSKLVIKKIRCLFGFKSSNKHYGNNDNVISPDKLPFILKGKTSSRLTSKDCS